MHILDFGTSVRRTWKNILVFILKIQGNAPQITPFNRTESAQYEFIDPLKPLVSSSVQQSDREKCSECAD